MLPTNSRNTRNDRESNQTNDKTRAGFSSNAGWSFRASFAKKVIKTENSLCLINEDRWNIYLSDFFSLFLGVQSAPEVGPTSYETPRTSARQRYTVHNAKHSQISICAARHAREQILWRFLCPCSLYVLYIMF